MPFITGVLADIGTDHGYLAIEAVKAGLCTRAVACDIRPGPLDVARANIAAAGLEHAIDARLGDGLAPLLPGEADTIVVAGMGGMMMKKIIFSEIVKAMEARLVLQPQHDAEMLRRSLHSKGFEIFEEKFVMDDGRFYVILVASFKGDVAAWNDREYFLGKHLEAAGIPGWRCYLRQERNKIAAYIGSIKVENEKNLAERRLGWISEVLG